MSGPEYAEGFEWDDESKPGSNTAHLSRSRPGSSRIEPWEAEEVYYNRGVLVRNKRSGTGDWKLVGRTDAGRILTIVLHYNEESRLIRAITGWESTPGERSKYLSGSHHER